MPKQEGSGGLLLLLCKSFSGQKGIQHIASACEGGSEICRHSVAIGKVV